MVVETPDAVLVVPRDRAQDVAKTVERLRDTERTEHRAHITDYRPWGQAQTLVVRFRNKFTFQRCQFMMPA